MFICSNNPNLSCSVSWANVLLSLFDKKTPKMIGPTVVPNELIPPAKLKRCAPCAGLPRAIANGFAHVYCNENPKPMIKNEIKIAK